MRNQTQEAPFRLCSEPASKTRDCRSLRPLAELLEEHGPRPGKTLADVLCDPRLFPSAMNPALAMAAKVVATVLDLATAGPDGAVRITNDLVRAAGGLSNHYRRRGLEILEELGWIVPGGDRESRSGRAFIRCWGARARAQAIGFDSVPLTPAVAEPLSASAQPPMCASAHCPLIAGAHIGCRFAPGSGCAPALNPPGALAPTPPCAPALNPSHACDTALNLRFTINENEPFVVSQEDKPAETPMGGSSVSEEEFKALVGFDALRRDEQDRMTRLFAAGRRMEAEPPRPPKPRPTTPPGATGGVGKRSERQLIDERVRACLAPLATAQPDAKAALVLELVTILAFAWKDSKPGTLQFWAWGIAKIVAEKGGEKVLADLIVDSWGCKNPKGHANGGHANYFSAALKNPPRPERAQKSAPESTDQGFPGADLSELSRAVSNSTQGATP